MSARSNGAAASKRPAEPSPAEARKQMAEAGDVEGLWQIIRTTSWTLINLEETFKLLFRAIEVASLSAPERFSAMVFGKMISLTTYLAFRTHYYASSLVTASDANHQSQGRCELPRELTDDLVPRLAELQGHVAELLQRQAHTRRLWQLAREKQLKNDRAEAKMRSAATKRQDVADPLRQGLPTSNGVYDANATSTEPARAGALGQDSGDDPLRGSTLN